VLTSELLTENGKIYVNLTPKYHGKKRDNQEWKLSTLRMGPLNPAITEYVRTFEYVGLPDVSLLGVYLDYTFSFEPVDWGLLDQVSVLKI
jgi:hypothetical protein